MRALVTAVLFLAVSGAPLSVTVEPDSTEGATVLLEGNAPAFAGGEFSGTLALNGSPASVAIRGPAERDGERLRIPVSLRYADVPSDWAERFRAEPLEYRVRGTVGGKERVEWSGALPWTAIAVRGDREMTSRFVRLVALELTRFSLIESEARASVAVRNPFAFPLKIASAHYRLFANGREVGSGEARGLLLHPRQENRLDFPIDMDHGSLLAAAGSALASGGRIAGRLRAELVVRLPGGDIPVPLDLAGDLALLSE